MFDSSGVENIYYYLFNYKYVTPLGSLDYLFISGLQTLNPNKGGYWYIFLIKTPAGSHIYRNYFVIAFLATPDGVEQYILLVYV